MKKLSIVVYSLFFMVFSQVLYAQNIDMYAVSFGSSTTFGKVNLQDGSLNSISTINQSQNQVTGPFSSAFNQANRRYLFLRLETVSNPTYGFNSVDVVTGSQVPSSIIQAADRLYGLQYDLRLGKLYGLRFDTLTSQVFIANADPVTGRIISENPIEGVASFCDVAGPCNPQTAFDSERGIYLFFGLDTSGNSKLYSVEYSTGRVFKSSLLTPYVFEMQYDITSDALYGIRFDSMKLKLFEIDVANGAQKAIVTLSPEPSGFVGGSSCFDQQSETYIFIEHTVAGERYLVFYDIKNGRLKKVQTTYQLWEPEIDNSSFATAHFGLSPVSVEPSQEDVTVNVFPNPAVDKLNLATTQLNEIITSIRLRDMTGREVLVKVNLNTNRYTLDVSDLPKGTYHARLQLGDRVMQRLISINPK